MDMPSIIARLAGGLAVALAAIVAGVYLVQTVYAMLCDAFAPVAGVW